MAIIRRINYESTVVLLGLTVLAFSLRFLGLGNTFQSSDNAGLAVRILSRPGYLWMVEKSQYGLLINLLVKVFVGIVSHLGVSVTEFWWKAPIAFLGTLQVPLTYLFLKRVGCEKMCCLLAAAFISVLPIHVMLSRYMWSGEILGTFFITLAIWAVLNFFDSPTAKNGITASWFLGLYLISHGYIVPFIPCLITMVVLFSGYQHGAIAQRFIQGYRLLITKWVFLFPILFISFYAGALLHTLEKKTRLGFFLPNHIFGLISNVGALLFLAFIFSVILIILIKKFRSRNSLLFFIFGISYLAPLFFLTPPGITLVRGYTLIGIYFFVLLTAVLLDQMVKLKLYRKLIMILTCVCFFFTLYGTMNSIFGHDKWFNLTLVRRGWGGTEDPGTKAAGYLIRKYIPLLLRYSLSTGTSKDKI